MKLVEHDGAKMSVIYSFMRNDVCLLLERIMTEIYSAV